MRWRYSLASKEYLHRTPSKKAGREIIWGNHSLEAKERFPQTPSKKTDWVKAKKQEIRLFLRRQKGGRSPKLFSPFRSLNRFFRRLQGNRNNRLVIPSIIDALANFGSYYKSVVQ